MIIIFVGFIDQLIDYPIDRVSLTGDPHNNRRNLDKQCIPREYSF